MGSAYGIQVFYGPIDQHLRCLSSTQYALYHVLIAIRVPHCSSAHPSCNSIFLLYCRHVSHAIPPHPALPALKPADRKAYAKEFWLKVASYPFVYFTPSFASLRSESDSPSPLILL